MIYAMQKCSIKENVYPRALENVSGMPDTLFYKGDISLLNNSRAVG